MRSFSPSLTRWPWERLSYGWLVYSREAVDRRDVNPNQDRFRHTRALAPDPRVPKVVVCRHALESGTSCLLSIHPSQHELPVQTDHAWCIPGCLTPQRVTLVPLTRFASFARISRSPRRWILLTRRLSRGKAHMASTHGRWYRMGLAFVLQGAAVFLLACNLLWLSTAFGTEPRR